MSASHLRVLTSDGKSALFQVIEFVVIRDNSSRQLHRGEKTLQMRRGELSKEMTRLGRKWK